MEQLLNLNLTESDLLGLIGLVDSIIVSTQPNKRIHELKKIVEKDIFLYYF